MSSTRLFLKRIASAGSVFCPEAGIWFPCVYRVHWSKDVEPEPPAWPSYSLDTTGFDESARLEKIGKLDPGSPTSVLVKRHGSRQEALGFSSGIDVFDPSQIGSGIFCNGDGVFTISSIPTYKVWPAPLLIYQTDHPANNFVGSNTWILGITPQGEYIEGDDVFFPGMPRLPDVISEDFFLDEPAPGQWTNPF